MSDRRYTLSSLYDADVRTKDPVARRLAGETKIPHPLNNVQYADGISKCRHSKRHGRWQWCAQQVIPSHEVRRTDRSPGVLCSPLLSIIHNADELDERLSAMNEAGVDPVIPFVDAKGTGSVAYGTAPSGDDWVVDLAAPRDPDTGTRHCCRCQHNDLAAYCDAGGSWQPTYPLTALVTPEVLP
jgi:hypothetical protein